MALSLSRSLKMLSNIAALAVVSTIVCIILTMHFAVANSPTNEVVTQLEDVDDDVIFFSMWPSPRASFKNLVVSFLGIAFAFVGQLTLPSFIAEMEEPRYAAPFTASCGSLFTDRIQGLS